MTDSAERKLRTYDNKIIKLAFDHEGCGCVMSGVPALWLVDEADGGDVLARGSALPILYEKRHAVFFEDSLTIDYDEGKHAFQLKSKQQTYHHDMPVQYK